MEKLSISQSAVFEMSKFGEDSIANIAGDIFFQDQYGINEVADAVNELLKKTDILRSRIFENTDGVFQTIIPYCIENLKVEYFQSIENYTCFAKREAEIPVPLDGCLYRITIVNVCGRTGVFCVLHHIIGDAWSMGIIAEKLNEYLHSGNMSDIVPYSEHMNSEHSYLIGKRYEKDKQYWLSACSAREEEAFLSSKRIKSNRADRAEFILTEEQTSAIKKYCLDNNLSNYSLFLTAVSVWFHRITDSTQFYIGTPVLNRSTNDEKNTIGLFINTIPLPVAVPDGTSFGELACVISDTILSAFRHQKYHYSELLKELRKEKRLQGVLYDVIVSYQNVSLSDGIKEKWYCCKAQAESLQIHIDDRNNDGVFHIAIDYQTEKFKAAEIERMYAQLICILTDGIKNSRRDIWQLALLPEAEYRKVVYSFNDTAADYPKEKCVHQLFEELTALHPENTALIACDKTLTYGELNESANRIAHALINRGVTPGDIVAFKLLRRSYLIATMLGILKAGAAYMPIDPSFPQGRIDYMLDDSKAAFCVDENNIHELLADINTKNLLIEVSSQNSCYCIYTSGSTGKPKGIIIAHKNIINFSNLNQKNKHCISAHNQTSVLSIHQVCFDVFMYETIFSLINNIKVILCSDEEKTDSDSIAKLIQLYQINMIHATPSRLQILCHSSYFCQTLKGINLIMVGAEVFTKKLYYELRKYTDATLYNGYGPSETTIGVAFKKLDNADITIGKPIANTQIYIVDKHMHPVPIGVQGELCIAGDGVGAGYLNRPELTAERFIDNPFGEGILYKSGDLAKWREDGEIEFIGRNDFQVKIRGLRIELGEIQNAVSAVEGISQAVVVVRKDSTDRQLICVFYTGNIVETGAIRKAIASHLPKYMIPHIFTHLDSMPLTTSGKINLKELPEVDLEHIYPQTEYIPPVTQTEIQLCELMAQTLHTERVGIIDDFFDLGGDSLKAIEFISKAHTDGIYFFLQNICKRQINSV